jgi:hypothetical protein
LAKIAPHAIVMITLPGACPASTCRAPSSEPDLDDRQALEYMRRVLRQLASGQDPAS